MTLPLNSDTNGERESQQGGPATPLEALEAFKEVQERRVAHWKEYDEASTVYQRSEARQSADASQEADEQMSNPGRMGHRCGPAASTDLVSPSANGNSHYHSATLPMTDDLFSKIVSLVTSGLLDCAHSSRAIETELRTALSRPDLARLVGRVQDRENKVLRSIVDRDQTKRIVRLEGRDLEEHIARLEAAIKDHRGEITDTMEEISAEMAELRLT